MGEFEQRIAGKATDALPIYFGWKICCLYWLKTISKVVATLMAFFSWKEDKQGAYLILKSENIGATCMKCIDEYKLRKIIAAADHAVKRELMGMAHSP